MICRIRDYGAVTVITAQTPTPSPSPSPTDAGPTPERAALAGAIDAQAQRMDLLSAAIVRATSQVAWSGRAAERFRARAAERARECLQLAVALRASAERVHAAATAAAHGTGEASRGHKEIVGAIRGMVGGTIDGVAAGSSSGAGSASGAGGAGSPGATSAGGPGAAR